MKTKTVGSRLCSKFLFKISWKLLWINPSSHLRSSDTPKNFYHWNIGITGSVFTSAPLHTRPSLSTFPAASQLVSKSWSRRWTCVKMWVTCAVTSKLPRAIQWKEFCRLIGCQRGAVFTLFGLSECLQYETWCQSLEIQTNSKGQKQVQSKSEMTAQATNTFSYYYY